MLKKAIGWSLIALSLLTLLGLGTWQLQRRQWKHELLTTLSARMSQPATAYQPGTQYPRFTPLTLSGQLIAPPTFIYHLGQYRVISLLAPTAGSTSRTGPVLVELGLVPEPQAVLPKGPITLTGPVRELQPPAFWQQQAPAEKNFWYRLDLEMAHKVFAVEGLPPFYLQSQTPLIKDITPRPLRLDLPNNHLQYALTWYGLALALLVIVIIKSSHKIRRTS